MTRKARSSKISVEMEGDRARWPCRSSKPVCRRYGRPGGSTPSPFRHYFTNISGSRRLSSAERSEEEAARTRPEARRPGPKRGGGIPTRAGRLPPPSANISEACQGVEGLLPPFCHYSAGRKYYPQSPKSRRFFPPISHPLLLTRKKQGIH